MFYSKLLDSLCSVQNLLPEFKLHWQTQPTRENEWRSFTKRVSSVLHTTLALEWLWSVILHTFHTLHSKEYKNTRPKTQSPLAPGQIRRSRNSRHQVILTVLTPVKLSLKANGQVGQTCGYLPNTYNAPMPARVSDWSSQPYNLLPCMCTPLIINSCNPRV